jgi:hypothetical protein
MSLMRQATNNQEAAATGVIDEEPEKENEQQSPAKQLKSPPVRILETERYQEPVMDGR